MNHFDRATVNTPVKRLKRLPAARAFVVALVLASAGAAAQAVVGGLAIVSVIALKVPGAIAMPVQVDAAGRFALQLQGAGDYSVFTSCNQECPPHKIIGTLLNKPGGTDASPPMIGVLIVPVLPAQAGPGSADSFDFTLKTAGPVLLRGELQSAANSFNVDLSAHGKGIQSGNLPPGPPSDPNGRVRAPAVTYSIRSPELEHTPPGNTSPGPPSATISQSGGTLAMERIKQPSLPDGNGQTRGLVSAGGLQPILGLAVGAGSSDTPFGPPGATISQSGGTLAMERIKQPSLTDGAGDTAPGKRRGDGIVISPRDAASGLPTGSIQFSTRTEPDGSFEFSGLPAGNYTIIVTPVNDQPVRVGANGTIRGKLQADGRVVFPPGGGPGGDARGGISDRWGNLRSADFPSATAFFGRKDGIVSLPTNPDEAKQKEKEIVTAKEKSFAGGFGTGNALGGGFGGGGPGTMLPSAGPMSPMSPGGPAGSMGGGGPMSPAARPMGSGPGRP